MPNHDRFECQTAIDSDAILQYERGELVDVLWGELEWSSPTDDDELPEVIAPEWIVDKVAHYGG